MKKIKIIGAIVGVLGFLLEGVSGYIEEKKMEEMIDEKVSKRLAENDTEES